MNNKYNKLKINKQTFVLLVALYGCELWCFIFEKIIYMYVTIVSKECYKDVCAKEGPFT
jgi:hypothetical protein